MPRYPRLQVKQDTAYPVNDVVHQFKHIAMAMSGAPESEVSDGIADRWVQRVRWGVEFSAGFSVSSILARNRTGTLAYCN